MNNNGCTSHVDTPVADELRAILAALNATGTSGYEPPMSIRAGSETVSAAPDGEESDDAEDDDEDDEDEDDDEDDGDEDDDDGDDDDEGEEEESE